MVDWHARTLIRTARDVLARDEEEGEAWRSAAAAEGLLRLRHPGRRQACVPLLHELLDRTARLDVVTALKLLAARLGEHGDVLTSDCVDLVVLTAVRGWEGSWQAFPGVWWQRLAQAMDAAGLRPSLWERVTRHLGRSDADAYRSFRVGLAVSLLHAKGEPRIALLVELGLLDEAAWWCEFGDVAFLAGEWDLAQEYWRRAGELGFPEIARRLSVLALSRAVDEVENRLCGLDSPDEPEWDPGAGPDRTRPWRERDQVLGLIREARELDRDWDDENRFCLLACGLALGLEEEFGVDPDELPELDLDDDGYRPFWLGFLALRGGHTEQARAAFAAAEELGPWWHRDARRLVADYLAALAGGPQVPWDHQARSEEQNDGFVSLLPDPVLPGSPLDRLLDGEEEKDELPGVEVPEDEAPGVEAPEDEAPGVEVPEDRVPGVEIPEDEAREGEAPEDARPS